VIDYLNSQGRSERWKSKKDWFEVGHGGYLNGGLRRNKEIPWMMALPKILRAFGRDAKLPI
jgi:hypothetical protein